MKSIRKAALACVASAVLALPFVAGAQGPANQDTFFTFSQDVELPNKTLPAGKYLFQLADSPSNRHVVKVMSADRKEIHATLLAIPYYSNERPSDEPQVRFMETPRHQRHQWHHRRGRHQRDQNLVLPGPLGRA